MTGKKLAKGILATTAGALALMTASHAAAQTYADFASSCVGTANVACIAQIGDGNNTSIDQSNAQTSKALVYIQGDNNGTGNVASVSSGALTRYEVVQPANNNGNNGGSNNGGSNNGGGNGGSNNGGSNNGGGNGGSNNGGSNNGNGNGNKQPVVVTTAAIAIPANLPSGTIVQRGPNNSAEVRIQGSNNDFYVSQEIGGNWAAQRITGSGNTAVIIQNGNDTASQTQIGNSNVAYVKQSSGANNATLYQQDSTSEILLEQSGGASATLSQYGGNNDIALRQTGVVTASITQYGNRSIAIDQQAGMAGASAIAITQY
ncbi:MAG: hypothetical protein EOO79_01835 [Oxalobacteraceae bacterium]|nr:MAG: hypothetical protein EOO79_01835 [Oxalobacteraceae bacterium]